MCYKLHLKKRVGIYVIFFRLIMEYGSQLKTKRSTFLLITLPVSIPLFVRGTIELLWFFCTAAAVYHIHYLTWAFLFVLIQRYLIIFLHEQPFNKNWPGQLPTNGIASNWNKIYYFCHCDKYLHCSIWRGCVEAIYVFIYFFLFNTIAESIFLG